MKHCSEYNFKQHLKLGVQLEFTKILKLFFILN
jgi:hypothetical protein